MYTALETLPKFEASRRQALCQRFLHELCPEAGGLLVCSRIDIYYLTGSLALGLLWLPLQGEAVLLLRKGTERAKLESPLENIFSFKSYGDLAKLCAEAGSPLSKCIAADMGKFTWGMSQMLQAKLPEVKFVNGDAVLQRARSLKSPWEVSKMRLAGERHRLCIEELLPAQMHSGMSELEIAHLSWKIFLETGHTGIIRMQAQGEENFLGFVSAGESSLYPTYYNGPTGCKGVHSTVPFMGDAGTIWQPESLLATDLGYTLEGYQSDKSQVYWSGKPSTIPDIVKNAHAVACEIYLATLAALRPGAIPAEIWTKALHMAEKLGQSDGFMGFLPDKVPFLGHGIGLTVDEYPAFAKGFMEPLQVGMTVAIEPKISVPGYGMVGLENTILITDKGCESLTGEQLEIIICA